MSVQSSVFRRQSCITLPVTPDLIRGPQSFDSFKKPFCPWIPAFSGITGSITLSFPSSLFQEPRIHPRPGIGIFRVIGHPVGDESPVPFCRVSCCTIPKDLPPSPRTPIWGPRLRQAFRSVQSVDSGFRRNNVFCIRKALSSMLCALSFPLSALFTKTPPYTPASF